MTGLFITATGTGIGKTYVTQHLLQCDQAQKRVFTACKPIISGWPCSGSEKDIQHTDTALLLQAQHQPCTLECIENISPWRFSAPLSPDLAAASEN